MNAVALVIAQKKICYKNQEAFKSSKSFLSHVTILRLVLGFFFSPTCAKCTGGIKCLVVFH